MQDGGHIERIPQENECRNEAEGCLLERASAVAQGVLEEIEALAGTTACKSVQMMRGTSISLTQLSIRQMEKAMRSTTPSLPVFLFSEVYQLL